jgi:phosphoglycerate dehydrogenase-like enzyme
MKVVATITLAPEQHETLKQAAPGLEIVAQRCRSKEEVSALLAGGCDVMLGFLIPDDLTAKAPQLKWVQLLSAGADHAMPWVRQHHDIPVTTASGIHATAIAEYALASMLSFAHRLHVALRSQLHHEWHRRGSFMEEVDPLRGKTLGVIGYGSIGRETARIATALGMKVIALKRSPHEKRDTGWSPAGVGDPEGKIPIKFFGPDECAAALSESDHVLVTLPLTPATRKFIGAAEIEAMRPGAYLVNIGRGEVIDEAALTNALRQRKIGGAGLDVFEQEPLDSHSPLWDLENVILTPHISGASRDYMQNSCSLFAENLRRFNAGEALLNVIDPVHEY